MHVHPVIAVADQRTARSISRKAIVAGPTVNRKSTVDAAMGPGPTAAAIGEDMAVAAAALPQARPRLAVDLTVVAAATAAAVALAAVRDDRYPARQQDFPVLAYSSEG